MAFTLAHLSDLHFGTPDQANAPGLVAALLDHAIDHVVVSGDLTHRGRGEEYERFSGTFAPLRGRAELSVIPGNHDRLGHDIARSIMGNQRVVASHHEGLTMIRLDSTGPHNCRYAFEGHGLLHDRDLVELDRALVRAVPGSLVVVTLHHHPVPLREESGLERLSSLIGLPYSNELAMGRELLACLRGRCDLLLHGHRHVPCTQTRFGASPRPLRIYNAGSSTEMGRARVFHHEGGRLVGPPQWLNTVPTHRPRVRAPAVEGCPPPQPRTSSDPVSGVMSQTSPHLPGLGIGRICGFQPFT